MTLEETIETFNTVSGSPTTFNETLGIIIGVALNHVSKHLQDGEPEKALNAAELIHVLKALVVEEAPKKAKRKPRAANKVKLVKAKAKAVKAKAKAKRSKK